jgi:hypothetical protein
LVLEILERAKGDAGEGIPWNADPKDVRQEINYRTWKAGYTDRDGQPKEDSPKIRSFGGIGKTKLNVWPRDSEGNLIDD